MRNLDRICFLKLQQPSSLDLDYHIQLHQLGDIFRSIALCLSTTFLKLNFEVEHTVCEVMLHLLQKIRAESKLLYRFQIWDSVSIPILRDNKNNISFLSIKWHNIIKMLILSIIVDSLVYSQAVSRERRQNSEFSDQLLFQMISLPQMIRRIILNVIFMQYTTLLRQFYLVDLSIIRDTQMKGFWLTLLLIQIAFCEAEDQFFYQADDYVQIDQNSSLQLELTLSSKADQYTSEGKLSITILISQNTSLPFNILYFNNQNTNGQQCYQNWIQNHQVSVTSPCSLLNSVTEQSMPPCMNYTSCIDQDVTFSLHLSDDLFRQNYIVLQNSNYQMIGLRTEMKVELDSDNWWFYWGVGLTCLLMISLVIFSGIVFYWSLKYKKMKKMFDQFKLTEDSETIKND